jgi:hypothetical protein
MDVEGYAMLHFALVYLAITLFGALGYMIVAAATLKWSRVRRRRLLYKTQAIYLQTRTAETAEIPTYVQRLFAVIRRDRHEVQADNVR